MVVNEYIVDFFKKADKLIQEKSSKDEEKAAEDIMVLNDLLQKKEKSIFNFYLVNERLREEYPLIDELENCAFKFGDLVEDQVGNIIFDNFVEKINADKRGIYVTVLIKHKVVKDVREVIKGYTPEKGETS